MPHRSTCDQKVTETFTDQVRAGLERLGATRGRLVVAVSGGPDSTALLVALDMLRRQSPVDMVDVVAAHANHGLRGDESERDERFVRDLCDRFKVQVICRRLPVPHDAAEREEGIEATARDLRLKFLADAASEQGAGFVATAHTADDQAETVLQRIVRGTGLAGLAGIPANRPLMPGITLIRPLLHMRRAEIRSFLAAAGQISREDSSNQDLRFTRNRVRHEVLPYLANQMNPQVSEALVRLSSLAGEAHAVIDRLVDRLMRRARIRRDGQRVVWNVNVLRRAPRYVLCEAFRRLWTEQSWPQQELGQADLARLADLVRTQDKHDTCHLPGGIVARRIRNRLVTGEERATKPEASRRAVRE